MSLCYLSGTVLGTGEGVVNIPKETLSYTEQFQCGQQVSFFVGIEGPTLLSFGSVFLKALRFLSI